MALHRTKLAIGAAMLALTLVWPATPGSASAAGVTTGESALVTDEETLAMQQALRAEVAQRETLTAQGSVCYAVHLQNIQGWLYPYCDGKIAGTVGQNRQLEAFAVYGSGGDVCYFAHVQSIGWQEQRCDNEMAGTMGGNLQVEGIKITARLYRICYEAHVQNIGWQGQRCGGELAGTVGQNRQIEAITIDMK
ncbi:hypothetical protein NCC78_03315 [Micromonospora phytophila]|uniref:hypothetical protein n=1 Tax=Micromonospora phytophila TaxID=709888 RepID=UPI00202DC77D|nr:hypothetical protein [Micromonospora phytophila]MCM0673740.1 hypothetical protein [Micromonospora phytophila]